MNIPIFVQNRNHMSELFSEINFPQKTRGAFIRHAERYSIKAGTQGDSTLLTPKGMQDAVELGETLKGIPLRIYSSPVFRCMHTAEQIAKGHGGDIQISRLSLLGSPGAFIENSHQAGRFFSQSNAADNYKLYISGKSLPGHHPMDKAVRALEKYFSKKLNDQTFTLFISHDIFIMYYLFAKTGYEYKDGFWLDFLDGMLLE